MVLSRSAVGGFGQITPEAAARLLQRLDGPESGPLCREINGLSDGQA
jgi:hypothetical protein